ncbi:peptidoglycan-binding protein [Streptomyces sp. NBC_01799]|uniref:peptidoglycan-binding domain-containing protein n=1 Tax=Streptomyces sp. NBC_01800 TaxID=2975945 RepID=UPI002DDB60F9|nr:peptidoglycan-binding protein [Streptomyces sp. NBC_01800]WSA72775.1 peptidoglycan-binding protein [Streptomyces sp. NBC_01800]WSA81303.1 peptidoglycan-binding protein [Streptomyces sp. NBC_01799]
MRKPVNALLATLMVVGGGGLITLSSATSAAAATPTCNTVKSVEGYNKGLIRVPAYSATGSTTCALTQGNSGAGVLELQRALNKCFYNAYGSNQSYWPLAEDGDFGPNTKKALTEAQDYHTNVPADIDGVYGPITRDMLLWRSATYNNCWFF